MRVASPEPELSTKLPELNTKLHRSKMDTQTLQEDSTASDMSEKRADDQGRSIACCTSRDSTYSTGFRSRDVFSDICEESSCVAAVKDGGAPLHNTTPTRGSSMEGHVEPVEDGNRHEALQSATPVPSSEATCPSPLRPAATNAALRSRWRAAAMAHCPASAESPHINQLSLASPPPLPPTTEAAFLAALEDLGHRLGQQLNGSPSLTATLHPHKVDCGAENASMTTHSPRAVIATDAVRAWLDRPRNSE